jgi:diguanylate cyclase (GGDEF)-like protein/PAS domain S-box-containing protein
LSITYSNYRRRLFLICFIVNLSTLGLLIWKIHSSYIERAVVAREQSRSFVNAIEAHVSQSLQFIDLSLVGFSNAMRLLPQDGGISRQTIQELLSLNGSSFHGDYWILFIDANGVGVAASNNLDVYGTDYSDRDYFKVHRGSELADGLYVGEPGFGRVSKKRIFFLSRRVESQDGTFLGVIAAPIEASRFSSMFDNARFKDDVTISFVHKSGKVIASVPGFEKSFATDVRQSNLFAKSRVSSQGSYDLSDHADGRERIFSYREIEKLPLIVSVGVSQDSWNSALIRDLKIGAAILISMLIASLILTRYTLHSFWQLTKSRGDLLQAQERLEHQVAEKTGDLRRANEQLQCEIDERTETMQRLSLLEKCLSQLNDVVIITDTQIIDDQGPKVIYVNEAFEGHTGYDREEILGRTPRMLQGPKTSARELARIRSALENFESVRAELINYRKDGGEYWLEMEIVPVRDAQGDFRHFVSVQRDITEKKNSQELIWRQANVDLLTSLPNRHMFLERFNQEITKVARSGARLALMFLDLDRFKEVNDVYGHDVGDVLLIEAARRLKTCVRDSDFVARIGGDEFIILLPGLDSPMGITRVAQGILESMSEPFKLEDDNVYVSASVGIVLCPDDSVDAMTLLKAADQAMYVAKSEGRNRFKYFSAQMQADALSRMRLASDLRSAVLHEQFALVYQPIVSLANGVICKAEALIRWRHPQRGTVSPAEFIPVAEDTGIIAAIGDWVFNEAAEQAARWSRHHGGKFQISINASPAQFRNDGIDCAGWIAKLAALGLPGESIAIEITESLLLDVGGMVEKQLFAFRDAGMQVSLDDFGTGYSSLSYLKKLSIDYIKIDQSFVRSLMPGSDDMALCEAIIVMAHKLGLKVIAEGIETDQQRLLLTHAGCDYGQGYLFSKPVEAAQFDAMFTAMSLPLHTEPILHAAS